MFVRRFWGAQRLLKSLSGAEHHRGASRSLMAPNQTPRGLCLPVRWKEGADSRSEPGNCKQASRSELPAQALAQRRTVWGPLRGGRQGSADGERGGRRTGKWVRVLSAPLKQQQPFLGFAVSSGHGAGLCTSAAAGLSSLPLPACSPLHGQGKAGTAEAEHLGAALPSPLDQSSGARTPNAFPLPQEGRAPLLTLLLPPWQVTIQPGVVMTRAHQLSDRGRMAFASAVSPEVDTTKTTLVTGTFNPEAKGRMRLKVKC